MPHIFSTSLKIPFARAPKLVEIAINEDSAKDLLSIEINDDGSGMTKEEIKKVEDPFYTTKTVRRVGLGIPLLANAAQMAGGNLETEIRKRKGNKTYSNLCTQPFGQATHGKYYNDNADSYCRKFRC